MDIEFEYSVYKKGLKKHYIYLFIGAIILAIINYKNLRYIIIYFILHIIIDKFICQLNKKWKKINRIYLLHSILHIFLIYYIGEIIGGNSTWVQSISNNVLRTILLFIIILKPINVSFKTLFQKYAPEKSSNSNETIEGAGAVIGNLERLLIAILIYYNQFGSIGLVFTAKSVARFDKISKDPTFAEYYLIGSLFSILSVLLCYGIIIQ